jgi:mono/diheme cytochrome c family protein
MKKASILLLLALGACGCHKQAVTPASPDGAKGAAVVVVSGDQQAATVGTAMDQPLVVQVNDAQGNAVPRAIVSFSGPRGVHFDPPVGGTDDSGQFSTVVSAPWINGHFPVVAAIDSGKVKLSVDEIALGYQETLGRQLSDKYCARCHDPESTPGRVSNMDNLDPKPHAFSDGATYDKISDADLISLISHGGAALNKSPSMPPFGYTLSKTDIQAVASYVRAVAEPPYQAAGNYAAK